MKRRAFITGLAGAAAWPVVARGQHSRVRKIGFLYPGLSSVAANRLVAFREGLYASGFQNGQFEVIARSADNEGSKCRALALEILTQNPDVLVAISYVAVEPARAEAQTVPIIALDLETDPIASGIASSLAHPGGNTTGVYFDFPDFSMKWMELLKEAIPQLARVVVMTDPTSPSPQLRGIQSAAALLGGKLTKVEVGALAELEPAFRLIGEDRPDAVLILSSPLFGTNPQLMANLTLSYGLASIT
jgi:putative tryptophan/tyrosine transport system substrate-binding protein